MRARLIAIGERMPTWVAEGFAEYRKRLSHDLPLDLVELKPGARGKGRDDARAIQDVLEGKPTAFRDVALLNAAAAIVVAGKAKDLKAGFELAVHSVDSGEAEGRLDRLIVVSNDG